MKSSSLLPLALIAAGLIIFGFSLGSLWERRPAPAPEPTPTADTEIVEEESEAFDYSLIPTATDEPSQVIQDSAGLYSLQLPEDWQVTLESARGVRLSGLTAQSPDYEVEIDEAAEGPFAPVSYQTGAGLFITVLNQPLSTDPQPAGIITEQKPVIVDGVRGTYFVFREPSTAQGQLLEVRLEKAGQSFQLRWGYNPDTLPEGQSLFDTILGSFHFQM